MAESNERKPWLVLMIKAPDPGKVKTRLAAEIGVERATDLYRRFVEYLARTILGSPERTWRPVVAYSPADAEDRIRAWLGPILPEETFYLPQPEGDLGDRLKAIFGRGFEKYAPSIVAIGGDCLQIVPKDIQLCFDALRLVPLVMGEATDGGYWVIGVRDGRLEIFDDMPWSTPDLARRTRERARELLLPLIERPENFDIDTKADLDRLSPEVRKAVGLDE